MKSMRLKATHMHKGRTIISFQKYNFTTSIFCLIKRKSVINVVPCTDEKSFIQLLPLRYRYTHMESRKLFTNISLSFAHIQYGSKQTFHLKWHVLVDLSSFSDDFMIFFL